MTVWTPSELSRFLESIDGNRNAAMFRLLRDGHASRRTGCAALVRRRPGAQHDDGGTRPRPSWSVASKWSACPRPAAAGASISTDHRRGPAAPPRRSARATLGARRHCLGELRRSPAISANRCGPTPSARRVLPARAVRGGAGDPPARPPPHSRLAPAPSRRERQGRQRSPRSRIGELHARHLRPRHARPAGRSGGLGHRARWMSASGQRPGGPAGSACGRRSAAAGGERRARAGPTRRRCSAPTPVGCNGVWSSTASRARHLGVRRPRRRWHYVERGILAGKPRSYPSCTARRSAPHRRRLRLLPTFPRPHFTVVLSALEEAGGLRVGRARCWSTRTLVARGGP